ncbi:MAG TPA: carboxypeptidase regulatory-like domain-containing protein, partial [Candidatus Acidoferrum sp.]|nr:carboxypeptidase regulatory-like domain-containing protein [Candidatus Acidoferrum sp.]
MKTILPHLALTLILIALLAAALQAQNPRGSLRGKVQDSTGARIPSAKIVAQQTGSNLRRETLTEDRGEFRLDDLPAGNYQITITAVGFEPGQAQVSIPVAAVRDIAITLNPPSVQATIKVQAEPSSITSQPIGLASAVQQGVITGQDLQDLPLASRSFANIAYLVPGTEPVEPSDPTKARITAVSTGGSSGLNNELSVDGADNSDDWIGGFLQNFSPDAIQEFAVRTANEDADTGGTTAGSVVITTKRGTNEWHGSGAFYERAAALNARFPIENPEPNPKQPFSRQNYVATLGGPLRKDKIWLFSSLEYVRENASIAYSPASTTQFDALAQLASEGLIPGINSIPVPDNVPIPFRDYIGSLRFDWSQSSKSQWFFRTSEDNYLTHNALVQQATLPSTGLTTHNNYWNTAVSNTYAFNPQWLGSFLFDFSELHLTQVRNSTLGFALAFPFSATSLTVSGFETFGDNQFATPITRFPSLRNQEKYQLRYDLTHQVRDHALKFGVNFIHEPVLGGAFPGNQETLHLFPHDPTFYLTDPAQFAADYAAGASTTPAGNGSFSQNIQRLALYAEDSWRVTRHLTVNYGTRYQTTFGLFTALGRSQADNPAYLTLQALQIPVTLPHDDHRQFAPRLGIAYSPGDSGKTVLRAGFGMFYNDLAQNGWATAFQAVNSPPGPCIDPVQNPAGAENTACIAGRATGGVGNLIDGHYKTPYAIHVTGGIEHAINQHWTISADYTHEEGNHAYRAYSFTGGINLFTPLLAPTDPAQANNVPNLNLFKSDNRSSYNAMKLVVQGNTRRFSLIAHYTLSHAQTWGCLLGELFDYVNGVCDPLHPFSPGDYGPSGEDVTHRFVLAGTLHLPAGIELTTLTQLESARPLTLTTPAGNRAVINGVRSTLDEFRGTPYIQADL